MLRSAVVLACASSAAAFAPAALPSMARTTARSGVTMQLYKDGVMQGKGLQAVPFAPAPETLPADIPGYVGFDPLGLSTLFDLDWLREAEIKHGRVAMLAATGAIVQDVFQFPGVNLVIGDAKMIGAHDKFIAGAHSGDSRSFAMHQIIFWVGLLETLTFPAIFETMNGGPREPGNFYFDPLGLGKGPGLARKQLTEIKNGRLAMIGVGGMVHHYLLTGKGPLQFLSGIPNYKSCIAPAMGALCQK